MTDSDIKYWWGWDQNKYRWRVPLTSACSLAGACCPGFQMIHLEKGKLDDGNYTSCQALAPCSRSGRPPRGRFWCWTTPPWGICFKYRIDCSKNKSEQKPWSKENPEHSSGSVDSGRKSNVNTTRWDQQWTSVEESTYNVHGSFIAVKLKNTFALRSCPYSRIVIIIVLLTNLLSICNNVLKKTFKTSEKNRSHRVLRLGLHPWQGSVGGVEMREHLSISWSENLKQRKNEILIVNLSKFPLLD